MLIFNCYKHSKFVCYSFIHLFVFTNVAMHTGKLLKLKAIAVHKFLKKGGKT